MAFDLSTVDSKQMLGKMGESLPQVCAVSGRVLVQPWVTYHLGGGYFCRVLARFHTAWNEERRETLKALLPAPAKAAYKTGKTEGED